MRKFGEILKELRVKGGYSQKEIADKMGFNSASIIGMYERGERTPTIDTVSELADILEVTPGYLLGDSIGRSRLDITKEAFAMHGIDNEDEMEKILKMAIELYKMKKGLS